jgi:hypothetical protein
MHFEEIGEIYSDKIIQIFVVDTSKEGAAKLRFRHRLACMSSLFRLPDTSHKHPSSSVVPLMSSLAV